MAAKRSRIPGRKSKKKKKPIKYRQVVFKLTDYQKKALDRYCKTNKLTPVRFMKSLINSHVARFKDESRPPSYVTNNQLELFAADSEE